jgi:hypothetical protein
MVLPPFPRCVDFDYGSGRGRRTERGGGSPPPDSDPFSDAEFGKNLPVSQAANVRCGLTGMVRPGEHRDLPEIADSSSTNQSAFIRAHNETLFVAMRVCNPDRSSARIHGFPEIAATSLRPGNLSENFAPPFP